MLMEKKKIRQGNIRSPQGCVIIPVFPLDPHTTWKQQRDPHPFSLQVTLTETGYIYFITAKVCAQINYVIKGTHINCHLHFENNRVILHNRILLRINTVTLYTSLHLIFSSPKFTLKSSSYDKKFSFISPVPAPFILWHSTQLFQLTGFVSAGLGCLFCM